MTTVAVIAHRKKTFGGGLDELRSVLAHEGVEPLWYEVPKSKKVPAAAREALAHGADLIFVWGGDGTVQRCLDARRRDRPSPWPSSRPEPPICSRTNLDIPQDIAEAVRIGLHGHRRQLDLGRMNGEAFGVMAGAGLDALMIRDADRGLKDRAGRLAYVWTGLRNVQRPQGDDDDRRRRQPLVRGRSQLRARRQRRHHRRRPHPVRGAEPDDGVLEIGVIEAEGAMQWARVFGRMAVGTVEKSPLTRTTSARKIDVRTKSPMAYELDGGHRGDARRLKIRVRPGAVHICVSRGRRVVSTAAPVPETWELTGDDARETLLHRGRRSLVLDAFQRMRSADGFSHARSTAFLVCMLLVQAIIALVGLAIAVGNTSLSEGIVSSIQSAVPGPAGEFLTNAVSQAPRSGSRSATWLSSWGSSAHSSRARP